MSEGRRAIFRILENADEPLGPKEIAAILGDRKHHNGYEAGYGAVREMLSQTVKDGQVKNLGRGRYVHPGTPQNHPDNADILTNG